MNELQVSFDLKEAKEVYLSISNFYSKRSTPDGPSFSKKLSGSENLTSVAIHMLSDRALSADLLAFNPILIELAARLINDPSIERHYLSKAHHDNLTIEGSKVLSTLAASLTFTSEIKSLVELYLERKSFFASLSNCSQSISQSELQLILLAFYRLISTDRQKFQKFIDPVVLNQIIESSSTTSINKFLSILISSQYLFLSETVRNQLIEDNIKDKSQLSGEFDGEPNVNYEFLPLIEAQRLSNLSKFNTTGEPKSIHSNTVYSFKQSDLSPGVSIIAGVLVPNLIALSNQMSSSTAINKSSFVPIKKSFDSMKRFAQHITKSDPVMLVGTAGSGKTFLVNEIAKALHIEDSNSLIRIHLNQQTDSKSLLGTYTSGTKPGTFEWKNGVLTTAVKEGKWVLVEDIDKAPNEVLSILMGLLENRQLTIPSRGEVIYAANGFQLISTVRTQSSKDTLPELIGMRLWKTLHLVDLDETDLTTILNKKFPLLKNFNDLFIKCYFAVKSIYDSRKFVSMNKGAQPRQISIRDLMKFCTRCDRIISNAGITSTEDLIQDDTFDSIFSEAIDCFTSAVAEKEPIEVLIREIGEKLNIPTSRINLQLNKSVPVFQDLEDSIKVGRAYVDKQKIIGMNKSNRAIASQNITSFARTNHSARLMEKVGVAISMCEPLLLVGETGTGKTTVVQEMAKLLNKKLTVINVSQQTEVGDLLGGFKPINAKTLALPLQQDFEELFSRSFSTKNNAKFVKLLAKCFNKSQWKNVSKLWKEAYKMADKTFRKEDTPEPEEQKEGERKKRRLNFSEKSQLMNEWEDMLIRINNFEKQSVDLENSFVFKFVEGSLVKAVKNGDWLLLDEMNLASPETLDAISDLLAEDWTQRSILLSEKGDVESIKANNDFRIFGCMNPATDVGKKDLPQSIRSRFSEIYVHSPDEDISDLLMIIDKYIGKYSLSDEWVGNDIAELYLAAKKLSDENKIVDGANQKPHFSIRTLTRTLLYVKEIIKIYGLRRSLYEGFCMSFLTLLDAKSEELLKPLIEEYTVNKLKNAKSVMNQIPRDPSDQSKQYVQFKHYWIERGSKEPQPQTHYIITPFVEKNMLNLVRASSGGRFPVLIQGPTSAGKTSMINHLAKITGHEFVRINNHEHTDLQEYLGTYVSDDEGKLVFKEGILVEALRKGHWIVLDELNLAPTDVLEALNRLLDDNRELFIPETQEVVTPHPDFMLFATQNPPGLYGGRKVLSKAFRNRFLELHFDDIPQDELEVILRERCQIAPSYAKKIVEVYKELSVQRQSTRVFEQKNSFATLRDLFRWAMREAVGYEQLAANGYMLLAERVRRPEEKIVVKEALEKVMKVKLDVDAYYNHLEIPELLNMKGPVVWTKAMRRLAVLVMTSMKNNEPLLLVGETGCGKTTVCQMIAQFFKKELIIVNAHQNTETGDLLGAQRPVRNRSELQQNLHNGLLTVLGKLNVELNESMSNSDLLDLWKSNKKSENVTEKDVRLIDSLQKECNALFEWNDGPLVNALKTGSYFLLDEISLADDSVLERLNSVLEPERTLFLAEKGADDALVTASEGFQFLATMNPGGDYGKKELSPALRNRFTEIWVPSMEDFEDVKQIVNSKLNEGVKQLTEPIVKFSEWYGKFMGAGDATSGVISLRDILAWVIFINSAFANNVEPNSCLLHGACMVFIDALGTHTTAHLAENEAKLNDMKLSFVNQLSEFAEFDLLSIYKERYGVSVDSKFVCCGPFKLNRDPNTPAVKSFNLQAPTTAANTMRVIRAMQVHKPVLLEGSPGVGKTSLISALAQATGNPLTRINLSEQTDLIDLFGSDTPVEGGKAGEFVWKDAPFLRAMQTGEWVLLDEMNLASQSVLEGLNACLDHRGEAYIPELDKSFISHPNFKVFAAQNPQYQGGGRKGLPKSFVNRFSVVYVDMLTEVDLNLIVKQLYPNVDHHLSEKLIKFMSRLEEEVVIKKIWGNIGDPWEFNLRDTLRWLSLIDSPSITNEKLADDFFDLVVKQRFRTEKDTAKAVELFESIFDKVNLKDPVFLMAPEYVQCQNEIIVRNDLVQYKSNHHIAQLQCNVPILETIFRCINKAYPMILVGPSGSGKSELIKFAADIVGSKVYEFSMNSDIDSMDILGGYEQADITRALSEISTSIREFLLQFVSANLKVSNKGSEIIAFTLKLIKTLTDSNLGAHNVAHIVNEIEILNETIKNSTLDVFIEKLHYLKSVTDKGVTDVSFQWFDGLLVQAVEKGHWLILDNANLCSPSVLDRLNSLLERDGVLIINECTNADGSPRVIKPHKDFRLFITSDPKYGELSRAMRNRAVEVYVSDLEQRATLSDRAILGLPAASEDVENQIQQLSFNPAFKPVSSFVFSNDSSCRELALFMDFYNEAKNSKIPFASYNVVGFSSLNFFSILNDLSSYSTNISEITETSLLSEMDKNFQFFKNIGIMDKLIEVYSNVTHNSPLLSSLSIVNVENQFVSPLTNSPLLPLIKEEISNVVDSPETNFMIYVASMIAELSSFLENLVTRAKTLKVTSMSMLEQSAAVHVGRDIKKQPKLDLYKLVLDLFLFIKSAVVESLSDSFLVTPRYYEGLFDLLVIWQNITASSEKYNETAIRVYHDQILEWIDKHDIYSHVLLKKLISEVEVFSRQLQLSSGSAMTIIWNACRSKYPQTEEGWFNFEALIDLANRFDQVASRQFSENTRNVNEFRKLFLSLFDECLEKNQRSDFLSMLDELKIKIEDLSTMSDDFLNQRSHPFVHLFDSLLGFIESDSTAKQSLVKFDDDNLTLASLANRSTQSLTDWKKTELFKPYPKILSTIWNNAGELNVPLFDDSFLKDVLRSKNKIGSTEGGKIDETLFDIKFFIAQLLKNSPEVLADHLNYFSEMLYEWILFVSNLHIEMLQDDQVLLSQESLKSKNHQELKNHAEIHRENGHSSYADIFETYFMPSMVLLNKPKSRRTVGKAFVLVASGMIMLYMPNSTYDPAAVDHILYDDFLKLQTTINGIRESFFCARNVYFGDKELSTETNLPSFDDSLVPDAPRVYRDKQPLDNLFDEWYAFYTSYIDSEHVNMLLETASTLSEKSTLQIENFNRSASQFVFRLKDGYHRYSDLNDILSGFINSLRLGLILIHEETLEFKAKIPSSLWTTNLSTLSTTSEVNSLFENIRTLCKNRDVSDTDVESIYNFLIQVSAFRGASDEKFMPNDYLNEALLALYYRWTYRKLKEQEKESLDSGVFKFDDPTMDAEADFQRLFPDADNLLDVESISTDSKEIDMNEIYFSIAKSYMMNFQKAGEYKALEVSKMVQLSVEAFKSIETISSNSSSKSMNGSSFVSVFNSLAETFNDFTHPVMSSDIDFYNGSSNYETKKACSVIKKIQISVHELLKDWPEHATLSDLFRICQEFLDLPATTPIFRMLSKVETIFGIIVEWEKYAHKGVSLNAHYNPITSLIVSWRKLELASWKQVFINEEKKIERNIGKWWFHLFETLILPTVNGEELDDDFEIKVVSAINIFMSQTTYGEFSHRLNLLKSFVCHIEGLNKHSSVKDTLNNIIEFYKMFQPQILESIAATKVDLEKKVNEVILLASWKDINIDALKLSSKKSHLALYKVIRKYRDILTKPVKEFIENGIAASIKTTITEYNMSFLDTTCDNIDDLIHICSQISSWKERPQRLVKYSRIDSNMKIYIKDIETESLPTLHQYAKDIISEAERLRKETPKEYKKEDKKLINGLKNEKHKLFSNVIKELKEMGLKLRMTTDVSKVLTSVTSILASSKSLVDSSFETSDAFFFRLLDLLPRLRRSVSEIHDDIPPSEAQKCLVASEHLLFSLIANRHVLVRSDQYSKNLRQTIEELTSFTLGTGNSIVNVDIGSSLKNTQLILKWLPRLLDYCINTLVATKEFYSVKTEESILVKYKNEFDRLILSGREIVGSDDIETIEKVEQLYYSMIEDLNVWKHQNSSVAFIADSILEWCQLQNFTLKKSLPNIKDDLKTVSDLEADFRSLFNTILLVIQKLHKFQTEAQQLEAEDEDLKWLVSKQKRVVKYFELLYPASVSKKFNTCIDTMKKLQLNEEGNHQVSALISHMLPIIGNYFNLVSVVQNKLRENYIDVSRGSFELSNILYNLATKGFCQPELPPDEKQSDQMQEGTGLGDGEGATDNSKDVEDDEDLAEHAQQPNDEEKNKDDGEEENDDAVDIEGDMAGELENAPDEDENDDEGEDEDEQDLDEEIDDLDDSDPNAVDEKMWDEEAESNSKEKESDQMPEDSKDNDDMQAKEDEDDKKSDEKNENQENNGESDPKNEELENDEDAEEEENVGEQEDDVKNDEQEDEKFDDQAEQGDALELPDDLNLDGDDEDEEKEENEAEGEDDEGFDEMEDEDPLNTENKDVEMDKEEEEGMEEAEEEMEGAPAEEEEGEEDHDAEEEGEQDEDMFDNGNDINEEAGEASDEELMDVDEAEKSHDDESKEEQAQEENEIEGLDGLESGNNNDDINEDTAVQQQSGVKSEGAEADAKEEDENIGGTGGGADFQQNEDQNEDQNNEETEEQNESTREKASEAMKQLGDSLKEFHRRRQEIKESTDDDLVDQQSGERPDEFQHLEGDSAENETQALGAANKDQIQSIDDDMAIDDDEEELQDQTVKKEIKEEEKEDADSDVEMGDDAQEDFGGEKQAGGAAEQDVNNEQGDELMKMEVDESGDDESEEEDQENVDMEFGLGVKSEHQLRDYEEAEELWKHADDDTRELTSSLCEQLRLILEPTLSTKLRGDYKTGKRLNMKRIIPYIASQFRKDKIWMRRTKPSKRQYQIMISVDDSKSMSESKAVDIAFQSIALVSKALTQLESGQLCIMKFGEDSEVVHPFEKQFSGDAGINVFRNFDFQDTKTDVKKLVDKSLSVFNDARSMGDSDLWQLQIVLSDGVCEDHQKVERLVRRAREEKVMIVFVVIDGLNNQESIMDMNQVNYVTDANGTMKLQVNKYLDSFPFEFYVVVHDVNELPEMLSLILRQYFTELANS